MTKEKFRGTGTALVTPFGASGDVDERAITRIVEFQIEAGIDMLLPCGTTGEGATLELAEWERVVGVVVEQTAGRVPVIVGAGSNATRQAIRLAARAGDLGADGVLSVGPYYNKPTQTGFYEHFKAIAEAVSLPVVVYNVPSRTGSNIQATTVLRLAEVPGIAAVKEASGDLGQVMEILRNRPGGFRVLSGDDALTLAMMAMGADGVISVVANEAPRMFREMVDASMDGDFERARILHYRLLPLMRANMTESNPIPVKAVMGMMGLLEETYRLPLVPVSGAHRKTLEAIAQELGLIGTD